MVRPRGTTYITGELDLEHGRDSIDRDLIGANSTNTGVSEYTSLALLHTLV
jgi:hypothetical protein